MKKQGGLSLIELLVAMVLALVIMGGIIQVFLSNRQAFNLAESMNRVQESGRFAVNFISEAVRNSGSYGCLPSLNSDSNNVQSRDGNINDINAVQTVASTTANVWDASADGAVNAGAFDSPDTLSLLQLTTNESVVSGVTSTTAITLSGNGDFQYSATAPDYVLVGNCEIADITSVASVDSETDTTDMGVANALRTTTISRLDMRSTVSELQHLSFAIDGNENLTVEVNGTGAQNVVGGIENVQFQYGVDVDGDLVADYFDTITNVIAAGDEESISAVQINVLAVSGTANEGAVANVTTEAQTITFNEQTITVTDNRYRAVFSTTVALRNRMN